MEVSVFSSHQPFLFSRCHVHLKAIDPCLGGAARAGITGHEEEGVWSR